MLSVEEKLKICEMVLKQVPKTEIMGKFNIGKSVVNDICKKEEQLKKFKTAKSVKDTKAMKGGMFDTMNNALYVWFRQQREKGVPMTGPILFEKASEFHNLLYPESPQPFNSSSGFQWRFCNRFGIKSLAISGEKLSANLVYADEFVKSVMLQLIPLVQPKMCQQMMNLLNSLPHLILTWHPLISIPGFKLTAQATNTWTSRG